MAYDFQAYGGYESEVAWAADNPRSYALFCEMDRTAGGFQQAFKDRLPPGTRVRCNVPEHRDRTGTVLGARAYVEGNGWYYDIRWDGEAAGDCDRFLETIPTP